MSPYDVLAMLPKEQRAEMFTEIDNQMEAMGEEHNYNHLNLCNIISCSSN